MEDRLIVLIEHQSSINNNMPLRMLRYLSAEYDMIVDKKNLYKQKRIMIPAPEFIVLYNGDKKFPDYKELKLSDSFRSKTPDLYLELAVRVYNINKGHNTDIAVKSPVLSGYEEFIAEIKKNLKSMELREAIKLAVKTCISKNILVSFLERHSSEVENMIFGEWNMDDAKLVWQEEAREDTLEETAKSMLKEGLDVALIERVTKLPQKEILAFR